MDYIDFKKQITLFLFILLWSFSTVLRAQVTNVMVETSSFNQGNGLSLAKFVKEHIEKVLIKQPNVTIVDREFFNNTEKERETQKKASFMEGAYVKQGKSLGASLIIDVTYNEGVRELSIACIDVETNEKISSDIFLIKKFLINSYSIERPKYFGRFIEEKLLIMVKEMGLDINLSTKIIEISKQKKRKAIEVVIYCDDKCGFRKEKELSLYTKSQNINNGRLQKIGVIEIIFIESKEVAIAKVTKGNKEILAAYNNGQTINCRYE